MKKEWKDEAIKAYRDQETQDNEGGCREPDGFVLGYLTARIKAQHEIESWKRLYEGMVSELVREQLK